MASKPSKEETYWRDPSPHKIEPLSYRPDDLRDPRTFPRCSRPTSSRYSVLVGFPGRARHFLLLVSNMGRFPELTPVRRQTTEAWLPTLGAGDITLSLEWMPTSTRRGDWARKARLHSQGWLRPRSTDRVRMAQYGGLGEWRNPAG